MAWAEAVPDLSVFEKSTLSKDNVLRGSRLNVCLVHEDKVEAAEYESVFSNILRHDRSFKGQTAMHSLVSMECVGDDVIFSTVVGLGMKVECGARDMWFAGRVMGELMVSSRVHICVVHGEKPTAAFIRGVLMGAYGPDARFKGTGEAVEGDVLSGGIVFRAATLGDEEFRLGCDQARGMKLAGSMTDAPHNYINSESIVPALKAMITGVEMKVLDYEEIKKRKMGAFLAVGQGSKYKPQIVHYTIRRGSPKKKFAFVGKGVTFDTGGYNIKTNKTGLWTMKMDMGGAATVFGAADLLSRQPVDDIEVHFIGMMCDNMISAEAVLPGDIVTASNGKTIEVLNTDAEGRMALADGLIYATEQLGESGGIIVDLATLTGAQIAALGWDCAAIYSNDQEWSKKFIDACKETGDRGWPMPLIADCNSRVSKKADLQNCIFSDKPGSIVAAKFLEEFIDPAKTPWIHVDMAGPAWDTERHIGTGWGVSVLHALLRK